MNNTTHEYVKVLGKTRRVRKGSFLHFYSRAKKPIIGFAMVIGFVACVYFGLDSFTCGAVSADVLYDAQLVEVTTENGDTLWGLTEKLNPGLSKDGIQFLVDSVKRLEAASSTVPSNLDELKVGQKIYVYCNKELAKELNLK